MPVAHLITRLMIGGAQENTLFNVDDQHHRHGDQVCLIPAPVLGRKEHWSNEPDNATLTSEHFRNCSET